MQQGLMWDYPRLGPAFPSRLSYINGLSTIAFSLKWIVGTPEHIQETDFTAFFLHSDLPNNSRVLYLDGKSSGRIHCKFGSESAKIDRAFFLHVYLKFEHLWNDTMV